MREGLHGLWVALLVFFSSVGLGVELCPYVFAIIGDSQSQEESREALLWKHARNLQHNQRRVREKAAAELFQSIRAHLDAMGVEWREATSRELPGEHLPAIIILPNKNGIPLNEFADVLADEQRAWVVFSPQRMARLRYSAAAFTHPSNPSIGYLGISVSALIRGRPGMMERHEMDHLDSNQLREQGIESLYHGDVRLNDGTKLEEIKNPTDRYPRMSLEELYTYGRDADELGLRTTAMTQGEWREVTVQGRNNLQRAKRVAELADLALQTLESATPSYAFMGTVRSGSGLESPRFEFRFDKETLALDLTGKEGREAFLRYKEFPKQTEDAKVKALRAALRLHMATDLDGSVAWMLDHYLEQKYFRLLEDENNHSIHATIRAETGGTKYVEITIRQVGTTWMTWVKAKVITTRFTGSEADAFIEATENESAARQALFKDTAPLLKARLVGLKEVSTKLVSLYEARNEAASELDVARARAIGREVGRIVAPHFRWTLPKAKDTLGSP